MTDYSTLLASKRNWQPNFVDSERARPGAENCIERALALAGLELEVMDWVLNSRSEAASLGPATVAALENNADDEIKHDKLLQMAIKAYGVSQESLNQASAIMQAWQNHVDHPLVKVAVLESSVFFVILPIYRFLGGVSLRTASRDISGDETVHVRIHLDIAKRLGYSWSSSLDKLRQDTVAYMVENLDCQGKHGSKQLWLDSSFDLLHTGSAKQLSDTKAAVMPSFFETDARALPSY